MKYTKLISRPIQTKKSIYKKTRTKFQLEKCLYPLTKIYKLGKPSTNEGHWYHSYLYTANLITFFYLFLITRIAQIAIPPETEKADKCEMEMWRHQAKISKDQRRPEAPTSLHSWKQILWAVIQSLFDRQCLHEIGSNKKDWCDTNGITGLVQEGSENIL